MTQIRRFSELQDIAVARKRWLSKQKIADNERRKAAARRQWNECIHEKRRIFQMQKTQTTPPRINGVLDGWSIFASHAIDAINAIMDEWKRKPFAKLQLIATRCTT